MYKGDAQLPCLAINELGLQLGDHCGDWYIQSRNRLSVSIDSPVQTGRNKQRTLNNATLTISMDDACSTEKRGRVYTRTCARIVICACADPRPLSLQNGVALADRR